MRRTNPATLHPPMGGYSHMIRVPAGSDLLFIAGQVGADRDGTVPDGSAAQAQRAFANLSACLEAEGMTARDVVRLTVYVTDRRYIEDVRIERLAMFGRQDLPTSTFLIVSGLAGSDLLVEVDAIAARRSPEADHAACARSA